MKILSIIGFAIFISFSAFNFIKPPKSIQLFDGKTFNGWEGDTKNTWRIENGEIVGG